MKFLVALAMAVACAHADVSHVVQKGGDAAAETVKFVSEVNPESFNYLYETSNGIYANSQGVIKDPNSETPTQAVQGQFKYTGPDNVVYDITYTADENGYQPQGAHLPVPPEIPEQIARSLAYNQAHPSKESQYNVASGGPVPSAQFGKPGTPYKAFAANKPFRV